MCPLGLLCHCIFIEKSVLKDTQYQNVTRAESCIHCLLTFSSATCGGALVASETASLYQCTHDFKQDKPSKREKTHQEAHSYKFY